MLGPNGTGQKIPPARNGRRPRKSRSALPTVVDFTIMHGQCQMISQCSHIGFAGASFHRAPAKILRSKRFVGKGGAGIQALPRPKEGPAKFASLRRGNSFRQPCGLPPPSRREARKEATRSGLPFESTTPPACLLDQQPLRPAFWINNPSGLPLASHLPLHRGG